ncbi:hypothetical protein [Rheinheimera sp. MMS21-TC3]|uniref:hypothetical protein n=1 Tax=Rheinheimera sp. MMS21-TC3 TaxID=3072790 RepID=UPI0028C4105A|nr:hypothetical protein [Rheinheimera sp. MMS21-TC3]WNO59720.1 hypothetical protein RDV63_01820 [Rheinheimera sp. MMS21-TC3]
MEYLQKITFVLMLFNGFACASNDLKTYQLQTSVIHLISAPEHHYNKNIVVDGIFIGFNQNNLFFDAKHAEYMLNAMSINILDDSDDESLTNSSCSGEWVEVWGTFIKTIDPEISYFKGRIVVDKMILHKNGKTCWKRIKPSFLDKAK